tara:strand:- start:3650 stop:4957 length:1308 start_codon:yes stop_codon:yes gene_type:complete
MNKLDPFEELISKKLQNHKVDFSYDSWDAIEKKLPKAKNTTAFVVAVGIISIAAVSFFILKYNTPNSKAIISSEKTISKKPNSTESTNLKTIDLAPEKPEQQNHSISAIENSTDPKNEKGESKKIKPITPSSNIKNTEQPIKHYNENNKVLKVEKIEAKKPVSLATNDIQQAQQDNSLPLAEFTVNKTTVCCYETISFFTDKNRNISYYWDFDDGNSSIVSSPTHQFNEPGNYIITLKASNKDNPNEFAISQPISITVYPTPTANFNYEKIVEDGLPCISFTSSASSTNTVKWNFGDGSSSSLFDVIHHYNKKGIYQVSFEQTNSYNCIASNTQAVEILEDFNLFAPNSFTPDGDGINDTFIPESLKLMNVDFTMNIYNKQGKLIFKTKNVNQPWNGINQNNGQKCSQGSYIWFVQLVNKNGETEQYNGALLLLN